MRRKYLFLLVAMLLPAIATAQSSVRDADVDAKLNANSLSGIAPPTGSPVAAPTAFSIHTQKFNDPYLPAAMMSGNVILGQTDGKARVYELQGAVFITKKGSPVERKLKKGDVIQAGDTIHTDVNSKVSITFDESYKNAIQIPANSTAVVETIEPTNIHIVKGSVFSAVDGLPQGSTWKVSTPSAVAAVRGTLYLVNFQAADGRFFAATVNVPDDGKNSAIDIQDVTGKGTANVPEGKEINLKQGEASNDSLVKDLDPTVLDEILKFFEKLTQLRDDSNSNTPPTGGELVGTNLLDPAGPGVVGGNSDSLDPVDTGIIPNPVSEDEPASGCEYGNECYQPPQLEESCCGPCYG